MANALNTSLYKEGLLLGSIACDQDGLHDIGTPSKRLGKVYCTNLIGSISDPDVEVNNLRFPATAPYDVKITRSGTGTLGIDNNAGGAVAVNVTGSVSASTAVTTPSLTSTGALALTSASNGAISITPNGTGMVSLGRPINIGGNSDTFMRRSAANTVMFDRNGSGTGAIALSTNGGAITSGAITCGTVTSSGNIGTSTGNVSGVNGNFDILGNLNGGTANFMARTAPGYALGFTSAGGTAGSGVVSFRAPHLTFTSYEMRWPNSAGTAGQMLTSNGTNFEWSSFPSPGVTKNTRSDNNGVFGTADISYTKLTDKARLVRLGPTSNGLAADNNSAQYLVDTVANFGTLTYEHEFAFGVSDAGVNSISIVKFDQIGPNIVLNIYRTADHASFVSGITYGWYTGNFTVLTD